MEGRAGGRQVVPVEAREGRQLAGQAVEYLARRLIRPGGVEAREQVAERLDRGARLARRREAALEALHPPLDVDEGAVLLTVMGDRQGDVRHLGQRRVGPAED